MKNSKKNNKLSFSKFSLKKELLKSIKDLGFDQPTSIQEKVIPHLKSSRQDLIASAQTGTGKTAAFGLPWNGGVAAMIRGTPATDAVRTDICADATIGNLPAGT